MAPKRTFEQVSVVPTGVQSFVDRFGKRRKYDEGTPPIAQWRCNSTGLSQYHNLYFIAYGLDIHVYIPQFSTQAITEKPVLVFTSQPSRTGLRGYLDSLNPHAINSLIVQDLGNEEVVAVVRDDGDVDAFLVRHILQATERRAESGSTIGVVADEIRPIFQDNVESSAWGLAIHSEARILATSSNKHEVRIFKFGLIVDDDESSEEEAVEGDDVVSSRDGNDTGQRGRFKTSRHQDVTLHVINGNSNIPYIAFCNTGDDPEGRWLLTTDIGGYCRVMDLQKSEPSQTFRFGQSFVSAGTGGFDRLNAGWTIMFLDRRSFQPAQNLDDTLGLRGREPLPNSRDSDRIWDISRTTKDLPDVSEPFVLHRPRKRRGEQPLLDIRSPGGQSVGSSVPESRDASTRPSTATDNQSSSVEIEIDVDMDDQGTATDEEDGGGVEIEVEHSLEDDDGDEGQITTASASQEAHSDDGSDESDWHIGIVDDDDDPEDEGTEDSIAFTSFYNGDSVIGNNPRFAKTEDGSLCDDLPCPILHTSVRNIYLLQPSDQAVTPGPWIPPMVGLANPLRQPIQHDFEYLRMFERLNMSAQIPALGVVIVASQKGRAIVLGLTKLAADAQLPAGTRDASRKNTTYAMRVECVLPLGCQERENSRPFAPLHGLAVAPMQGSEGVKAKKKRWRLLLMYQDHSILSYEISRKGLEERERVDVEDVIV